MLVERNPTTTAHPKMDMTNTRTMELFRNLGLAEQLRAVSVPVDHPLDVSWVTTMTGYELHRFYYPSTVESRRIIRAKNDGSQPLEPPMRVSQVEIEPVLKAANERDPNVEVRFGVALEDFTEDRDGVTAVLRTQDGRVEKIRCEYLAGCDGGSSVARTLLNIDCSGRWRIMPRYTAHFRSEAFDLLCRWGLAWHYQSNRGTLVSQNGSDVWTLHARFPEGRGPDDVDPSTLIEAFVGKPFPHEILVANAFTPHLVVADRYSRGRVFLAGDAAHQYISTGGYGMNTGVADAFDLGWKLAATLHGFGGPQLLASYELERRPIGLRNCAAAERHNDVRVAIARLYEPAMANDDPPGAVARANASGGIAALGNAENESHGIEYGYAYADSPIVCADGTAAPQDPIDYVPTTVPGVRLPSVFLDDDTALFDRLGPWFTLLVFDDAAADPMVAAAAQHRIPLHVLRVTERHLAPIYEAAVVLVRPDQHVAWRGAMPHDEQAASVILGRALGWSRD